MEEYDVLGNFKNLKSVFKNIPTATLPQASCPPILDGSFADDDILPHNILGPKKADNSRKPKKKNKKDYVAPKLTEQNSQEKNSEEQPEIVGRRTRSRAKMSTRQSTESVTHEPALLSTNETGNTGKRRGQARDVMRARRNYIAEQASRCATVDVIDLITSPRRRIKGIIEIDDESSNDAPTQGQSVSQSLDEENPEMTIRIKWQFQLQKFILRKYQKFEIIFEQLAELEKIPVNQIFLNLNNKIVKPDDTPATINYKTFEFIEGRAMTDCKLSDLGPTPKKKRDPNMIKLKVLSDKFKNRLNIEMNKTENFRKLVIKCAEELKIPYENIIKLCFDGETLHYNQTPLDLELEGGEIIEIHLKE